MSTHEKENDLAQEEARDLASSSDEGVKKYYISQDLFEALQAKGFGDNAIKKSIVAGCVDAGTCTQWITMHEGHPELDTPLEDGVEVVVRVKRILTEAERQVKVQELKRKAQEKAEETKRLALEEERKRIQMGRKAVETKEMRDKLQREAELSMVKKQKEDDVIARRRIKLQILADKYVRQGKSQEEARRIAEEEMEEAARKKREESSLLMCDKCPGNIAQPAVASPAVCNPYTIAPAVSLNDIFDRPAESPSSLPRLVDEISQLQDSSVAQQCARVLRTILCNIRDNPFDMTKRSLKTSTSIFCTKIAPVPPALELLHTCGFQLVVDVNGNESLMATTVVIRVIEQALSLLPLEADA